MFSSWNEGLSGAMDLLAEQVVLPGCFKCSSRALAGLAG